MTLRTAFRCDAPSLCLPVLDASGRKIGDAELSHRINPNTGALEFVAPLTWTGVRKYRHADGTTTRELRSEAQVKSASHMRGLRLLSATVNHPTLPDKTPVYLDARGGPDVYSPDGSALRPAAEFEVGHTGDAIVDGEIGGYYVPLGRVAITDRLAQKMIADGRTQTSLGYTALLDDTPGVWEGPRGPEPYDVEHILDHEDPRVKQAVEDGVVQSVEVLVDGELKRVPVIGPNHFAVAIWAGRGELQSEIVDFVVPRADAANDEPAVHAHGRFLTLVADSAPEASDPRAQRAAATARVDEFSCSRLAPDLVEILSGASLTGRYEGACGWLGWIDVADGIAFVATDGLGLWWGERAEDGAVSGPPAAFAWRGPKGAEEAAYSEPVEVTAEVTIAIVADAEVEDAITEHAARQQAPGKFDKFLRFAFPQGPALILGRKGDGPWQVQSVRFPADDWTPADAKAWLKATKLVANKLEVAQKGDASEASGEVVVDDSQVVCADSEVSFVAPLESATYAHPVRGSTADARLHTMRKITLPARMADTAAAIAGAVKAPAPVKIADAMLEVELPEGADPAMLAAGMHALAEGVAKLAVAAGEGEAKAAEMGADFASAVNELSDLKTKIDALQADAEVGKAHRLALVVATAKKVGLTDSDVAGKDAEGVRTAAVAKRYPSAAKHLDSKVVLDGLWGSLVDSVNALAPAKDEPAKPAEPAKEEPVKEEPIKPAPKPRTDSAGTVVGAPTRAPILAAHRY